MIEKHKECLRALSDEAITLISELLRLQEAPLLVEAMEARGLSQADLVLRLLHAPGPEPRAIVAQLAHLHVAPPLHCLPQPHHPPRGEPWVEWVSEGHRQLPGPPVAGRGFRDGRRRVTIQVGDTLQELEGRGVTPAEVRAAARQGWLRITTRPRKLGGN